MRCPSLPSPHPLKPSPSLRSLGPSGSLAEPNVAEAAETPTEPNPSGSLAEPIGRVGGDPPWTGLVGPLSGGAPTELGGGWGGGGGFEGFQGEAQGIGV